MKFIAIFFSLAIFQHICTTIPTPGTSWKQHQIRHVETEVKDNSGLRWYCFYCGTGNAGDDMECRNCGRHR